MTFYKSIKYYKRNFQDCVDIQNGIINNNLNKKARLHFKTVLWTFFRETFQNILKCVTIKTLLRIVFP